MFCFYLVRVQLKQSPMKGQGNASSFLNVLDLLPVFQTIMLYYSPIISSVLLVHLNLIFFFCSLLSHNFQTSQKYLRRILSESHIGAFNTLYLLMGVRAQPSKGMTPFSPRQYHLYYFKNFERANRPTNGLLIFLFKLFKVILSCIRLLTFYLSFNKKTTYVDTPAPFSHPSCSLSLFLFLSPSFSLSLSLSFSFSLSLYISFSC